MDNLALSGIECNFSDIDLIVHFYSLGDNLCVRIKELLSDEETNVEEYVIFEVTSVSNKFTSENPIEVNDEKDELLGYLILGDSNITSISTSPSIVTSSILYFHLMDKLNSGTSKDKLEVSPDFSSSEYVEERTLLLVQEIRANEYIKKYMAGSDLWGSFSHRQVKSISKAEVSTIRATPYIDYPTEAHKNKAFYATSSDNSFTRFLNKYQILELMFDYIVVAKLRASNNELTQFRDIMSAYSRDEINSLKSMLNDYVKDTNTLVELMYNFEIYQAITFKVFQQYSKDSNPLKKPDNWSKFWSALESRNLTFATVSKKSELKFGTIKSQEDFATTIRNVVAYWIYRVRCSIAHNKIGEHIFTDSDEEFVCNVAEPLLDCVLSQILTEPDFKSVIETSAKIEALIHR